MKEIDESTGKKVDSPRNLSERLLDFGAEVVKLTERLPNTIAGRRIGDQLLRSGTSVGANYEEAQAAESQKDFIHKIQLALKELREAHYWLRLLGKADISQKRTVDRHSRRIGAIESDTVQSSDYSKKEQLSKRGRRPNIFAFYLFPFAF